MNTRDTRNIRKDTVSKSGVVHRNTAQYLTGFVNPRTFPSPRNKTPLLSSRINLSRINLLRTAVALTFALFVLVALPPRASEPFTSALPTPPLAANIDERLWEIGDIVHMLEAWEHAK